MSLWLIVYKKTIEARTGRTCGEGDMWVGELVGRELVGRFTCGEVDLWGGVHLLPVFSKFDNNIF